MREMTQQVMYGYKQTPAVREKVAQYLGFADWAVLEINAELLHEQEQEFIAGHRQVAVRVS